MDIEKLKEFAATIKHCGDYGELFVNEQTKDVIWVAGDADFDPDEVEHGYCTGWDAILEGFKIDGVDTVNIEAESGPGEDEGYINLGRFGIDNWDELKDYYENR